MEVTRTNKLTNIQTRTHSSRPSRRRELWEMPFNRRSFSAHRERVVRARPRIDNSVPSSSKLGHIRVKSKKEQKEIDRQQEIQKNNMILLQHLSNIARSKRVDDGNVRKLNWNNYEIQIMVTPRLKNSDLLAIEIPDVN